MPDLTIPELSVPFVFRRRPTAIPPDLRPLWRIHLLLLLLRRCCRRGRSSFARLHVLSWATLSPENRDVLLSVVEGQKPIDTLVVRVEPSLNRAVDFAIGEGLIRRVDGDRYELTPAGVNTADALSDLDDCLAEEKNFMDRLSRNVTERLVNEIFRQ